MPRSGIVVLAAVAWAMQGAAPAAAQDPGDLYGEHTYDYTVRIADQLFRVQPRTTWEQPAHGEAADFIEFIADDRLLVGVIDVNRHAAPGHSKLYLVDATSGALLWEYERDNLSGGSYSLLLTEPHLLLMGADGNAARFDALDPATGRELWDVKVDAPYSVALASEHGTLIVLHRDDARWKLRAFEIERGERLWELELDQAHASRATPATVSVAGGSAFVVGRAIVEVGIANGTVTRTIAAAPLAGDNGSALLLDDGALTWDPRSISYVDTASGTARWTATLEAGVILSVAVTGGTIVRSSGDAPERVVVSALDPADGRVRWSHDVRGPVVSPIASEAGLLVFTTDSTLIGLRPDNGSVAFAHDLPDEMKLGTPSAAQAMGLPDVVRTESGVMFVSRERAGLAAFDLPAGTLRWYQRHYDANFAALNYTADGRYAYILETLAATGRADPSGGVTPPPSLAAVNRATTSHMLAAAQRDYQAARSRYDALRSDPNATRDQRAGAAQSVRLAADAQIIATEMQIAAGRFNAGLELANALVGLADAIGQMIREKGFQGLIDRAQLMMQGSLLAQHRLFQQNYHLRPFYLVGRGRGVSIVDTRTGLRRDIVFSPHSPPSIGYGLDLPSFAVSPDSDQLIAFGISLRSDRFERRGKWGTRLPNYSILSYDLGELEFSREATVFASVVDATATNDSALVASLLDRGGDVNERHPVTGETPMMFAAAASQLPLVRLLLAHGADVNVVSDSGNTALAFATNPEVYDLLVEAGGTLASGEVPPRPAVAAAPDVPPVILAVTTNQPGRVRELVEAGEDVNQRNQHNETPLFYAAAFDRPDLVALLLELGADVNAISNMDQTALDLARSDAVRDLLRAAGGKPGSEVRR